MQRSLGIVSALGLAAVLWSVPTWACWQLNRPSAVVHGDYVQGHVLRSGKPLVHSHVVLRKLSQEPVAKAVTDGNGRFILRQVSPGKYQLIVHGWGYENVEVQPTDVKIGNQILRLVSVDDSCLFIESES
jgi:Carboxypeptidase regulatory-like domain